MKFESEQNNGWWKTGERGDADQMLLIVQISFSILFALDLSRAHCQTTSIDVETARGYGCFLLQRQTHWYLGAQESLAHLQLLPHLRGNQLCHLVGTPSGNLMLCSATHGYRWFVEVCSNKMNPIVSSWYQYEKIKQKDQLRWASNDLGYLLKVHIISCGKVHEGQHKNPKKICKLSK